MKHPGWGMIALMIAEILQFLSCPTPKAWVDAAVQHQDILLIDHAHCEKKAAATALSFIHRYGDKVDLVKKMSRLAREELRHFEKVLDFIKKRQLQYGYLSASRYAGCLREHIRLQEPGKLVDQLIIGAFIEARSCERFHALVPVLDNELAKFYHGLLASEAKHFQDYLQLARRYAKEEDIMPRIQFFAEIEAKLIHSTDDLFRFHSGVLV